MLAVLRVLHGACGRRGVGGGPLPLPSTTVLGEGEDPRAPLTLVLVNSSILPALAGALPSPRAPPGDPPLRYSGGGRDEIAEPFLGFRFFAISLFLKFFYSSRVLALYRVPYRTR